MPNPCSDDDLEENEAFVDSFRQSVYNADDRRGGFLRLLKEIILNGRWRKRRLETGVIARFDDFRTFLEANPPEGLHVEIDLIEKLVSEDLEAQSLLDQELKRESGRPKSEETVNNINGFPDRPMGTSSAQAIRTLREKRPDLLAKVIAGAMTPNGAMVEAGFRKRHYSIDLEDASIAARAIRKHASSEYVAALIKLLQEP